jgi:hypothetical protein
MILILLIIALIIKVIFFLSLLNDLPLPQQPPAIREYYDIANNIILYHKFAIIDENGLLKPVSIRPPGYPFVIALIISLFGVGIGQYVLVWINYLIGIFTGLILYQIVKSYNPKASYLAFAFYSCNPIMSYYESIWHAEPLYLFFLSLSIYFTLRGRFIYSIVFLALSSYFRPVSITFAPIFFAYILFQYFKNREKLYILKFLFILLVFFILLFPWYLRNKIVFNRWFFSNIGECSLGLVTPPYIYSRVKGIDLNQARKMWVVYVFNSGNFSKKYAFPDTSVFNSQFTSYWDWWNEPEITYHAQKLAFSLYLSNIKYTLEHAIKGMAISILNPSIYGLSTFFDKKYDPSLRKELLDKLLSFDFSSTTIEKISNFLLENKIPFLISLIYLVFNFILMLKIIKKVISKKFKLFLYEWMFLLLFLMNWFVAGFAGLGGTRYFINGYIFFILLALI